MPASIMTKPDVVKTVLDHKNRPYVSWQKLKIASYEYLIKQHRTQGFFQ